MNSYKEAAREIRTRKHGVGFTGAGISTESGIPDFRSSDGIWSRYDIQEYGYLKNFIQNPEKVWNFIHALENDFSFVSPNAGHYSFYELEKAGFLKCVITQNIDGLHQRAGNSRVYELHGSMNELHCLKCAKKFPRNSSSLKLKNSVPICECGSILKPSIVFFGEPLPAEAFDMAVKESLSAGYMIIAGTSAAVYPAAQIPYIAKKNGVFIIEINAERTPLTSSISDIFFEGKIGIVLPELVKEVLKS